MRKDHRQWNSTSMAWLEITLRNLHNSVAHARFHQNSFISADWFHVIATKCSTYLFSAFVPYETAGHDTKQVNTASVKCMYWHLGDLFALVFFFSNEIIVIDSSVFIRTYFFIYFIFYTKVFSFSWHNDTIDLLIFYSDYEAII